MREPSYRWRRTTGIVTLLTALALWCAWIRSTVRQDLLIVFIKQHTVMFCSASGSVSWNAREEIDEEVDVEAGIDIGPSNGPVSWHRQSFPITADNGNETHATTSLGTPTFVPYAPVVISLTVLSAFLLLWKPRTQTESDAGTAVSDAPPIS